MEQFYKQNEWNENMQQGLEKLAQRCDQISAIQEALAILQAEIPEIRKAVAALQGDNGKDGIVGRKSKRLP